MNEVLKRKIEQEKKDILNQLKDCRYYGMPVDLENTDMLIVAAYYLGRQTELWLKINGWEMIREL